MFGVNLSPGSPYASAQGAASAPQETVTANNAGGGALGENSQEEDPDRDPELDDTDVDDYLHHGYDSDDEENASPEAEIRLSLQLQHEQGRPVGTGHAYIRHWGEFKASAELKDGDALNGVDAPSGKAQWDLKVTPEKVEVSMIDYLMKRKKKGGNTNTTLDYDTILT